MIQGYLLIDTTDMAEGASVLFNFKKRNLKIHMKKRKKKDPRELHSVLIQNPDNIPEILEELSVLNPEILGLWNLDGTPYGIIKTIDDEGIETLEGEIKHPYKKNTTELYLSDLHSYDKDGNIIKAIGKLHHTYAGYTVPQDFEAAL